MRTSTVNLLGNWMNYNPKIFELFKRIWLYYPSFILPFNDIFDEVKNERYKKLFNSNEAEVSKYLQLIEEPEQESESKEMIEKTIKRNDLKDNQKK